MEKKCLEKFLVWNGNLLLQDQGGQEGREAH